MFQKFREHLSTPRTGTHVSDLMAPLLSYWKQKTPLPLSEDEVLYFLGGIAHHTMLVAAMTGISGSEEKSFIDEATGITYSPDLAALKGEFKTTRAETIPRNEEEAKRKFGEYIRQCRAYATLLDTTTYTLIVFYFAVADTQHATDHYTPKKPHLRAYTLTFSRAELDRERVRLSALSTQLRQAIVTDDPSELPLCQSWRCYTTEGGVKVGKCPYWDMCKPRGRYEPVANTLENTL